MTRETTVFIFTIVDRLFGNKIRQSLHFSSLQDTLYFPANSETFQYESCYNTWSTENHHQNELLSMCGNIAKTLDKMAQNRILPSLTYVIKILPTLWCTPSINLLTYDYDQVNIGILTSLHYSVVVVLSVSPTKYHLLSLLFQDSNMEINLKYNNDKLYYK